MRSWKTRGEEAQKDLWERGVSNGYSVELIVDSRQKPPARGLFGVRL